jgi:integrase
MLRLCDLRIEAKRLAVDRLKNGHPGEYILTEDEVSALKAWLRARGLPTGKDQRRRRRGDPTPLFPGRFAGTAISRRMLDKLMRMYGEAAGLPAELQHFHTLRHSCATSLMSDHECGIEEVQDHLGHADIRSTQIYARITSKRRDDLGRRVQRSWKV